MPIIILILIASAIVRSDIPQVFFANYLVAAVMALFVLIPERISKVFHVSKSVIPIMGLCLIMFQFFTISWIEGRPVREMIQEKPQPERYAHDTKVFLRIYNLMNEGVSYHQAMANSYDQDARTKGNPPDVWGFRMPTVFYFWQLATFHQPMGIYILFMIMGVGILICSYRIMALLVPPTTALLAPVLIVPYLVMGATTPELLQMEWWGILPLFICIWGIIAKKSPAIFFGATFAVLCRETYALPISGLFIAALIAKDKKTLTSICLAGIGVFLLFLLHFQAVSHIMTLTQAQIFTGRQHALTIEFVRQVLAYATQRYLGAPYRLFSVYLLFSCVFAFYASIKQRQLAWYGTFIFPIMLSLIAFVRIGLCCWSDYWGVMLGPLLCLVTAIIIGLQLPNKKLL